ncbi:MAG: HAD-superfamily hydrolase, subfamily variant 1 [Chloroflexi bacterium]|jgi:phosphoglycolate phosphatase|nr:HAD-superfamily hydrolase, subfamily variant 1 [Chloroflexota bacterium]
MSSITHVFFDLDGTLTDPKAGITGSFVYALDKLGRTDLSRTDLDWCIGPPLRDSFARLLESSEPAVLEEAVFYYRERYSHTGLFENYVYPQIEETLITLHNKFRLLVATSKPTVYAIQILERFNLLKYFETVYGCELDGRNSHKGELIGLILAKEQLQPEQAFMIGDREYDILGAKGNRVLAGGVTYGYGSEAELKSAGADYIFHNPYQIPEVLLNYQSGS